MDAKMRLRIKTTTVSSFAQNVMEASSQREASPLARAARLPTNRDYKNCFSHKSSENPHEVGLRKSGAAVTIRPFRDSGGCRDDKFSRFSGKRTCSKAFFNPRSVAVIGASREEGKVGHDVLHNLIQYGYAGRIYPVNPKADNLLGLPCFQSVRDIPGEVDLAVLVIPAKFCLEAARDCAAKKVPALIIITAGFKETGREGRGARAQGRRARARATACASSARTAWG